MGVNLKWKQEDIDTIRKLVAKGLTSTQIATHFYNVTRNSIIGVCFRNGITFPKSKVTGKALKDKARANEIRRKALELKKKKAQWRKKLSSWQELSTTEEKTLPPTHYPPPKANEESLLKTFMEIRSGDCRAIIGDVRGLDTIYCAAPVKEGSSWCCKHHKVFTVPFQKKEGSDKSVVDRNAN